jgi:septum formation protein
VTSAPLSLILASRSPQRRAILEQLGIPFEVVVSTHDEEHDAGEAARTVERNALGKARDVLARVVLEDGELVLGVDTVVVDDDGRLLGKAGSAEEALDHLRQLAGRRHHVYSGLALTDGGREHLAHAVTEVRFRAFDEPALERYVAAGEWRERAGAYAIQGVGSALVDGVVGDYFNVVGLPVVALVEGLAAFDITPFSWVSPLR